MIVQKTWGYEEWVENNELYCLKKIVCFDEVWSSNGRFHFHKIKDETFFVLEGTLIIETMTDDVHAYHTLNPGASIRIRPLELHRFKCKGAFCKFIEASTHHEDSDSYRVD